MKPIWLIDTSCEVLRSAELQQIIRARQYEVRPVKFFPDAVRPKDIAGAEDIPIDANVICFGGPAFVHHVQQHRRWRPGSWCSFANFDCSLYYSHFGRFLLNDDYGLYAASEALRMSRILFDRFAVRGEIFLRPNAGRKIFSGKCVDRDDFEERLTRLFDPTELVVVSSPKQIGREWRLVAARRDVLTASQYADHGSVARTRDCPEQVIEFGREILRTVKWLPDPLFTMDIAESESKLRLIELNGFSCSSFYECDLDRIVDMVARTAAFSWWDRLNQDQ